MLQTLLSKKVTNIKGKIILAYSIFFLIPMIIIFYCSTKIYENNLIHQVNQRVNEEMDNITDNVEKVLDNVIRASNIITNDYTIKKLLPEYDALYYDIPSNDEEQNWKEYNQVTVMRDIEKVLTNVKNNVMMVKADFIIYKDTDRYFSDIDRDQYIYYSKYFNNDIYKDKLTSELQQQRFKSLWITFNPTPQLEKTQQMILMIRNIFDENYKTVLGTLIISIPEEELNTFIRTKSDKQEIIYLIDQQHNIISCSDTGLIGEQLPDYLIDKTVKDNQKGVTYTIEHKNDALLVQVGEINTVGWKLVYTVSKKNIVSDIKKSLSIVYLLLALFILFCFVITVSIITRFLRPIKVLKNAMLSVQKGDLTTRVHLKEKDEIGMLGEVFNSMLDQINMLVKQVEMEKRKEEELRIEVLQSQINPHFILNTLNVIKWTAVINQWNIIAKMLSSLGRLLETSIGKVGRFITIEKEMEYIKDYIYIQNIRMGDKYKLICHIDEKIKPFKILKFIVQPLVENSIIHGFEDKQDECIITIRAYSRQDKVIIEVHDNGCGIPQEKVNYLIDVQTQEDGKKRYSSIGLSNVRKRIELYYGSGSEVMLSSILGGGTTAGITLPLEKLAEER